MNVAQALLSNESGFTLLSALSREGRKLSLVIGVNYYPSPEFLSLPYVKVSRLADKRLLCEIPLPFHGLVKELHTIEGAPLEPVDWVSFNNYPFAEIPQEFL